jgi:hypothetical protein
MGMANYDCDDIECYQSEKGDYFAGTTETTEQQWKVKKWQGDSPPETESSCWANKSTVEYPVESRQIGRSRF